MAAVRRRLRLWAALQIAAQAIALSAWLPLPCCAAHQHATAVPPCHQQAASSSHCATAPATPAHCPMHHGGDAAEITATDRAAADEAAADCAMRGVCGGPASILAALLSHHGVLPRAVALAVNQPDRPQALAAHESLTSRRVPPEPPPPRS